MRGVVVSKRAHRARPASPVPANASPAGTTPTPELPRAQPEVPPPSQPPPYGYDTHARWAPHPPDSALPNARDRHAAARRAIAAVLPAAGTPAALRLAEVEGFPARLLPELPAQWSLIARALHARVRLLVTTSPLDYGAARARAWNVITGPEWLALTHAAEQARGNYFALHTWLETKRVDPTFEITEEIAAGGYVTPEPVMPLTVERVLQAWGMQLVCVAETDPMTEADYANH